MTVTIQVSLEQRDHLIRLLETAERKGGKSPWWQSLVRPLGGLARKMRELTAVEP